MWEGESNKYAKLENKQKQHKNDTESFRTLGLYFFFSLEGFWRGGGGKASAKDASVSKKNSSLSSNSIGFRTITKS
jgi:hypothetical protein